LLDLEFENTVPGRVHAGIPSLTAPRKRCLYVGHRSGAASWPVPLLYRLSRMCTKTVQREKQSESIRERKLVDGREEILTPDPLLAKQGGGNTKRLCWCRLHGKSTKFSLFNCPEVVQNIPVLDLPRC